MNQEEEFSKWDTVILPKRGLLELHLSEVWKYRDLLRMFVKRDFVTYYKQTILGPVWFFIQPIFTTLTYMLIFGNVAKISTDGMPQILFYMSGVTAWNYFAECFNKTSTVFKDNQAIFGKVHFPRLITPLSIVVSNLIKFGIQLLLFVLILGYYLWSGTSIMPNSALLLLPVLIALMAGLGLGAGMLITSMTTKYRDLVFLLQFGIQLLMYATPVIYPLSTIPEKYKWIIMANPMTGIIETFRYAFLGSGQLNWQLLGYDVAVTASLLILGTIVFNKTERTFMDTV
ncbi:lipopolysaccharide transport system permease protein [Reichenbachiella agariperforans]|uniref:Transport permease protein n=1 Tax=Reichenbachiella agariperforans TaxID=156994 RepID=A0A1M6W3U0_REIAG|nr:ABC transporter permease [Reichenbachiella agariperforans]SHK88452.1 lipopolysaccharide transport system permease protein [Reichenbachiella agariperforans]